MADQAFLARGSVGVRQKGPDSEGADLIAGLIGNKDEDTTSHGRAGDGSEDWSDTDSSGSHDDEARGRTNTQAQLAQDQDRSESASYPRNRHHLGRRRRLSLVTRALRVLDKYHGELAIELKRNSGKKTRSGSSERSSLKRRIETRGAQDTSQRTVGRHNRQHQPMGGQRHDATPEARASPNKVRALGCGRGPMARSGSGPGPLSGLSLAQRREKSLVGLRPHITAPPASAFMRHQPRAPSTLSALKFNDTPLHANFSEKEESINIGFARSSVPDLRPNNSCLTLSDTSAPSPPGGRPSEPIAIPSGGRRSTGESQAILTPLTGRYPTTFDLHDRVVRLGLAPRNSPSPRQLSAGFHCRRNSSIDTTSRDYTPSLPPVPGSGCASRKHDSNESLLFPIDILDRVSYSNTPSPPSPENAPSPTCSGYLNTATEEEVHRRQALSLLPKSHWQVQPQARGMPVDKVNTSTTTSTCLSPVRPAASSFSTASHMADLRRPSPRIQMPALPRFHPAVYQSPSASAVTSPTRSRHAEPRARASLQSHSRQLSDAQQHLFQYQREMIASATRAAPHGGNQAASDAPKAPALNPCGSPGPATPLMLEDQADYLTAGAVGDGSPREFVDRLIRNEMERRGGMGSAPSSPAVSPAGGRS